MRQVVETSNAPKPVGPYSQAIVSADFVFVAGQGPRDPKTGALEVGDVRKETENVLANIKGILEAAGSSIDKVVKCNVYLKDIRDFATMNEVYARQFKPPYPARTTIQAGALPEGISVEIECIARR